MADVGRFTAILSCCRPRAAGVHEGPSECAPKTDSRDWRASVQHVAAGLPGTELEEEVQDDGIVRERKEGFKDRN